MPVTPSFFRSPLAHHPSLLARKIAFRLGLYRENVRPPARIVPTVCYPSHWESALKLWVKGIPLDPPPHAFNRVFGFPFDEAMLLHMCTQGPIQTEPGLKADVKLIWDYSRGQPLFTNAAAGAAQLEACAAFIARWQAANRDTNGPAWTCAMEIAIRAINWIFADVLFAGELSRRLGSADWAYWLWQHGFLIWRRLETRLICSNHYLADLLGLQIIGASLPQEPSACVWLRFAAREFPRALLAQTRSDGGVYEASLRYHAYVTEMALLFRLAQGEPFPAAAEARLREMCRIVANFRDATGDVFAIGDDDSGRVIALDFASPTTRAQALLALAAGLLKDEFKTQAEALYLQSGWWICRAGDFSVALDFGGVGLGGIGGHAHNDDFSFCLDWHGCSVVSDPGTFLYTGNAEARNRFRSTFSHNTLAIDGREQRPLGDDLFKLSGPDTSFHAQRLGLKSHAFTRQLGAGISHRREVSVGAQGVSIRDFITGAGRHRIQWRFHLHPDVQARLVSLGVELKIPNTGVLVLENRAQALPWKLLTSDYSPGYGRRAATHCCEAEAEHVLPFSVAWTISAVG